MFKFYYAIKEDFKLNYLADWGFRYNENDFCWEYDTSDTASLSVYLIRRHTVPVCLIISDVP